MATFKMLEGNYFEVMTQLSKCDLFLMTTNDKQDSDTNHLRLYKEQDGLIYYIEGERFQLKDELVQGLFDLPNIEKNSVLERNKLSEEQQQACVNLLKKTENAGHTQRNLLDVTYVLEEKKNIWIKSLVTHTESATLAIPLILNR